MRMLGSHRCKLLHFFAFSATSEAWTVPFTMKEQAQNSGFFLARRNFFHLFRPKYPLLKETHLFWPLSERFFLGNRLFFLVFRKTKAPAEQAVRNKK